VRRFERVVFREEAMQDLRALAERSRPLTLEVFRLLKQLDAGELAPTVLHNYAKTGDLSDCGKIVVSVEGEPEHRVVVRDLGGHFLVSEVIAVDDRSEDLPYLLAGLRLGRLDEPVRRSEAERRIARLRRYRSSD
jgi:hypothetical protein